MWINQQSGLFALTLDPQVTLSGTVLLASGTTTKSVAATVVAIRPSRIIGRPDVVYQATVNPVDGSYRLVVSQSLNGESYALGDHNRHVAGAAEDDDGARRRRQRGRRDVRGAADAARGARHDPRFAAAAGAGHAVQATTVPTTTAPAVVLSTTTVTDDKGAFSIRLTSTLPDKVQLTATPTMQAADDLPSLSRTIETSKLGRRAR